MADWSVAAEVGRVFLTVGNFEFEIIVPPTLAEANPDTAAKHTAALLAEQLKQHA